jgi:t-SNARE complex subunit (syntaxin)
MKLTEKETKALRKLQKYERQFHKMRYFFLVMCIIMIALVVYTGFALTELPELFEGKI